MKKKHRIKDMPQDDSPGTSYIFSKNSMESTQSSLKEKFNVIDIGDAPPYEALVFTSLEEAYHDPEQKTKLLNFEETLIHITNTNHVSRILDSLSNGEYSKPLDGLIVVDQKWILDRVLESIWCELDVTVYDDNAVKIMEGKAKTYKRYVTLKAVLKETIYIPHFYDNEYILEVAQEVSSQIGSEVIDLIDEFLEG